jgi:hypothetical protein
MSTTQTFRELTYTMRPQDPHRPGPMGRLRATTGRWEDRGAGPSGPLGSPARLVIHYWAENISRTRVATDEPSKFCIVDRMLPCPARTNWASSFHSNPGNGASAKAPFEARVGRLLDVFGKEIARSAALGARRPHGRCSASNRRRAMPDAKNSCKAPAASQISRWHL